MRLPIDRVQAIMKMAQQPISLQSPVGDSDDTNFGDFIEDKGAENPYDMTAYSLLREKDHRCPRQSYRASARCFHYALAWRMAIHAP